MKVIGGVQTVGAAHFVDRASLLGFLDQMVAAESVGEVLRFKLERAEPVARASPLRISLPDDLRRIKLSDLPGNVMIRPGSIHVTGRTAEQVLEGLLVLAQVMENDLDLVRARLEPPAKEEGVDEELRSLFASLGER